jgi:hypothetical protein
MALIIAARTRKVLELNVDMKYKNLKEESIKLN